MTTSNCAAGGHFAENPIVTGRERISLIGYPSSQPSCNRIAMEVLYVRKKQDEQRTKLKILDCEASELLANERMRTAEASAKSAGWWGINGPSIAIIGIATTIGAFIAGGFIGYFANK